MLALIVPAAVAGILFERLLLGPTMSSLAASYASLSLSASTATIVEVLAGLGLAGAVAVAWVSHRISRESVTAGLRGDAVKRRLTRRQALSRAAAGAAALYLPGCGGGA